MNTKSFLTFLLFLLAVNAQASQKRSPMNRSGASATFTSLYIASSSPTALIITSESKTHDSCRVESAVTRDQQLDEDCHAELATIRSKKSAQKGVRNPDGVFVPSPIKSASI